jgi:CRISPR-associated protein Csy1
MKGRSLMEKVNMDVVVGFRKSIAEFLGVRLESKKKQEGKKSKKETKTLMEVPVDDLEQLSQNPPAGVIPVELSEKFTPSIWIDDAARRVSQLEVATHVAKAAHQNSKGSSLYADPITLSPHGYVGSYLLQDKFVKDVVGNAAALDVYKFLSIEFEGTSLVNLILQERPEVSLILSEDPHHGMKLAQSFFRIVRETDKGLTSHTLAKQVYWMTGKDPVKDEDYHLLLPLFESSLAHRMHGIISEDLYGEAAKDARKARREKSFSKHEIHEYTNLAMRKIGGTKPQNISQLNSERGGVNYLLASIPPSWKERPASPIWGTTTFFDHSGKRPELKALTRTFRTFLESDPPPSLETRIRRDDLVEQIIGEIVLYLDKIHSLDPGWSSDPRCRLSVEEKFLVDPKGAPPPVGWKEKIRRKFGTWLIHEIGKNLLLGDIEYDYFLEMLESEPWSSILGSPMEQENANA